MALSPAEIKAERKRRADVEYQATVKRVQEWLCKAVSIVSIGARDGMIPEPHVRDITNEFTHAGWKVRRDSYAPATRPDGACDYLEFKERV